MILKFACERLITGQLGNLLKIIIHQQNNIIFHLLIG
jgi:hypothetical protein